MLAARGGAMPRSGACAAWILAIAFVALIGSRALAQSPSIQEPAAGPPVQLVETIPVESGLGDPSLPQAAAVWVKMIDGARQSLDLEHFYLSHWPSEPTGPVIDAIGRAAARGVRVRLLLSVGFQSTYPEPADSLGKLKGIELRWIDMKKISGGGVQHGKVMIVDGEQVFVGSQNLDWRSLKHIHEMGVWVRNQNIASLFERVFEFDWSASAPGATPPPPGSAGPLPRATLAAFPLALVQGPGDTVKVWPSFCPRSQLPDSALWDEDQIVRLLDGAQREVVVQVLTYGFGRGAERDSTIDLALRRAAARGVHVRLLVSDWEADNPRIAELQRLTTVPNIEVRLSSVPEWSGGYIPFARVEHCKYMVVDSLRTWVGTSNWEPDYFRRSRNAALTLENRRIARQARGVFETGWKAAASHPLTAEASVPRRTHGDTPPPGRKAYGK